MIIAVEDQMENNSGG